MDLFRRLRDDERGTTAVEYGLICALIVIAIMASMANFSTAAKRLYNGIATNVSTVM